MNQLTCFSVFHLGQFEFILILDRFVNAKLFTVLLYLLPHNAWLKCRVGI